MAKSGFLAPAQAKAGDPLAPAKKPDTAASALAEGEKPGQTVTIIDGSTGKRQEVSVGLAGTKGGQKSGTKGEAKPDTSIDPRFLESSRHGQIPKIAPDGARPSEVYAKPPKPQGSSSVSIATRT